MPLDSGDLVFDSVTVQGRGVEFSAANHRIVVQLPHRLQAGEQMPVSVTYHGQPHGGIRFLSGQEQVYTAFSTSQWMVCVDAPGRRPRCGCRWQSPRASCRSAAGERSAITSGC